MPTFLLMNDSANELLCRGAKRKCPVDVVVVVVVVVAAVVVWYCSHISPFAEI